MRYSLIWRFISAFLTVTMVMAILFFLSMHYSNTNEFQQLVTEQERLAIKEILVTYYQTNGSWVNVEQVILPEGDGNLPPPEQPPPGGRPPRPGTGPGQQSQSGSLLLVSQAPDDKKDDDNNNGRDNDSRRPPPQERGTFGLVDANGVVIVPLGTEYALGQQVSEVQLAVVGDPITIEGQVVGTILTAASYRLDLTATERAYLKRTNQSVLLATGISAFMAVLVGALLTWTLIRPLRELRLAMLQQDLTQEVPIRSQDEIGELTATFNQMRGELHRANQARRQMTADIAHDLRTPLQVIAGYIESMRDKVLSPTEERFDLIYTEIEHLQHLVSDLRTLSQADTGDLRLNLRTLSPATLLHRTANSYRHQAN